MPSDVVPFEDGLVSIVPGFTGQDLWDTLGFVMISWALLAFLPRWKWTPTLSLLAPIFHAAIYTSGMIMLNINAPDDHEVDFFTFEGVFRMFQNPNVVFIGWVHYIVFDCLVGRMIVMDSVQLGCSITFHVLAVIPSLFFTFMAGPMGWLLYMGLRQVFLSPSAAPTKEKLF
jgi:hypothetical protein